ncbi:4Fe-4S ferredoxin [Candidatus Bathyarchaeota archaeon ex4484_205]|nr:MAG: 4Fe-4S ferredoxin [Candidatus Bathyarchaeota archaeon ex4484_205]
MYRDMRSRRRLVQAGAFITFNLGINTSLKTGIPCWGLFCYACPFASTACPFGSLQHFIALGLAPTYLIGWLLVQGGLLGRGVCGWLCPFGALQDLFGGRKVRIHSKLRYLKYVNLAIAIIATYVLLDTAFCWFCPSGSFFGAVPYLITTGGEIFTLGIMIHLTILALAVGLFIMVSRFWCRYLCPLGAIYSFFNRYSLFNIKLDEEKCKRCLVCLESCPMGIRKLEGINGSDCIKCGECVNSCKLGALKYEIF